MTVRFYASTDSGAPTLSGTAGALIAVLKACLVDGYGSKASSGWTQEFSGTNIAVFRPPSGTRMRLRVNDTDSSDARVRGYEAMSDVNTGTGLFPTDVQANGGSYMHKSSAGGTPRGWVLVADQKRFILIVAQSAATVDASSSLGQGLFFGDVKSAKSGDAYHCFINAGLASGASNSAFGAVNNGPSGLSAAGGHFLARSYTQVGGAVSASKHTDVAKTNNTLVLGTGGVTYPDPITGGILVASIYVAEPGNVRGVLPGVWAVLHNLPASPGTTFSGSGDLAGKTFMLLDVGSQSDRGRIALEISDTWE